MNIIRGRPYNRNYNTGNQAYNKRNLANSIFSEIQISIAKDYFRQLIFLCVSSVKKPSTLSLD